ncbi:MAG: hypothetical protein ACOZCL_04170 [Bacillota bacterium]
MSILSCINIFTNSTAEQSNTIDAFNRKNVVKQDKAYSMYEALEYRTVRNNTQDSGIANEMYIRAF